MGHAFQHTIMDALVRHHRMKGENTLWVPGTDHAGIATQIVVERQLQDTGLSRHDLGRKNFVAQVWDWKETSGSTITRQMRRMGDSVAWKYEYFTMDDRLSAVVTDTFVSLYEQGLIYRGKRLVNWDPVLLSAVSDLEVENEERAGTMWHILYPFSDGPQPDADGEPMQGMHIATTRPETMLADGALAVHPDDERYKHLVGKLVDLPLCDRKIPIIADDLRRQGLRLGLRQDHRRARLQRLSACALRHGLPLIVDLHPRREDQRPGSARLPGPRPLRRAQGGAAATSRRRASSRRRCRTSTRCRSACAPARSSSRCSPTSGSSR